MSAGSCATQGCGCPVTGHQAGCPVSGHGAGCGCPVSGHSAGCPVSGHGAGPSCSGSPGSVDPFANAPEVWLADLANAMREVKMEIMKEKIRKAIGPQLEKAAEATWQAGGAIWQSLLAQSQAALAKEDLREQIRRIFSEKAK